MTADRLKSRIADQTARAYDVWLETLHVERSHPATSQSEREGVKERESKERLAGWEGQAIKTRNVHALR